MRTRHPWLRNGMTALVLAVWAFSLCLWSPAHACCQGSDQRMDHGTGLMPCCVSPALNTARISEGPQPPVLDHPALAATGWSLELSRVPAAQNRSRLSQQFIPDESGRHLRLCVLLN